MSSQANTRQSANSCTNLGTNSVNPLTTEELAAMRQRCEATTPGPWHSQWRSGKVNSRHGVFAGDFTRIASVYGPNAAADSDFIAVARFAIPRLLDDLDSKDAEIDRLKAELAEPQEDAARLDFIINQSNHCESAWLEESVWDNLPGNSDSPLQEFRDSIDAARKEPR